MQRHLLSLLHAVTAGAGLLFLLGASEAFGAKHPLQQLPVTGRLADGGTFTGQLTVQELTANDHGQLAASVVLTGTALPQTGTATKMPPRAFITRAPLLDLRGTCTTLVLDLDPIFLDPLRQEVQLRPVTLDMQALQKDERLLSTALCALARLQE